MEQNKYYTPSIEGFHIGFEYEVNQSNNIPTYGYPSYKKEILDRNNLKYLDNRLNSNLIRVKYLNKEDIESLGWEHIGGKLAVDSLQEYCISNFILYHSEKNSTFLSIDKGNQIFRGRIKNKSELKKLMSQLDIK